MKNIVVTTSWDDGHILDIKLASLLKKYSIKGTFYIAPKNREFPRNELLIDREVVRLSKDFEIGAHTMTHHLLPKDLATNVYKRVVKTLKIIEGKEYKMPRNLSIKEARQEIYKSKKHLEYLLGKRIYSFCYPGGRHNQKIQQLVKESGFIYARTIDTYWFSKSRYDFASGTTIHAYKHFHDVLKKAKFSHWSPIEFNKNMDWEYLAKKMFDHVLEQGGVYHLWGHSWIIDQHKDWDKLDRVLAYISDKKAVKYAENKELPYLD